LSFPPPPFFNTGFSLKPPPSYVGQGAELYGSSKAPVLKLLSDLRQNTPEQFEGGASAGGDFSPLGAQSGGGASGAAGQAASLRSILEGFPLLLLKALAGFDLKLAAEDLLNGRNRAARVGERWWDAAPGGGIAPACTPPPVLEGGRVQVAPETRRALETLLWEPEKRALEALSASSPTLPPSLESPRAATGMDEESTSSSSSISSSPDVQDPRAFLADALRRTGTALGAAWRSALEQSSAASTPAAARVLVAAVAHLGGCTFSSPGLVPAFSLGSALTSLEAAIEKECSSGAAVLVGQGGGAAAALAEAAAAAGGPASPAPLPWSFSSPQAAALFTATLLPLLHSFNSQGPHVLVVQQADWEWALYRLAAARALAGDSPADLCGSALGAWEPPCLCDDFPASSPLFLATNVPKRVAAALLRSSAELSAARWPGAMFKLAEVVESLEGPDRVGSSAWAKAFSVATSLQTLFALVSRGDMINKDLSNVLTLVSSLDDEGWSAADVEDHLNQWFLDNYSRVQLNRKTLGVRDPDGNLCATPIPAPLGSPLFCEKYRRLLRSARRLGAVYAWGVTSQDSL
jgi:hypothetical protein